MIAPDTRCVHTLADGIAMDVRVVSFDAEANCYLIESLDDPRVQGLAEEGELRVVEESV